MRLVTAAAACALVLASAEVTAHSPPIDANLGIGYPHAYTPVPDEPWTIPYQYTWDQVPGGPPKLEDKTVSSFSLDDLQAAQDSATLRWERAECHGSAAQRAGFDPDIPERSRIDNLAAYDRAFAVCLLGRQGLAQRAFAID